MYTDKHEWILIDGKTGMVGISHYAQVSLLMGYFLGL
jgi:glycine cleavage system H lipoate-binding protein